jgi:zinc protease
MLQLNYLKLTSPRMDKDLFAGFMAKYQSQLEYLKSNPEYTFLDTMNRFLQNNSPLANIIIPTAADLNRLNAERVLEMYNAEFGNADGFHFFIVGNVDVNTLKPLMEKYLASLPAKGAKAEFKDNGLRPITGNNVFEFKKGAEPKSLIFERYFGEIPFSQDLAIRADLLGNILNIKGIEELREKIGGIYSGNISAALAKEPYSRYSVNVYLPCGPESVDTLLKAVAIEMERIKAEGPTEKDLAKVKIAKIEAYKEGLRKNETWTSYLGSVYSNNLDKAWVLDYEKLINSITAEEIKATANQLLNAPNHFRAVLYPEK